VEAATLLWKRLLTCKYLSTSTKHINKVLLQQNTKTKHIDKAHQQNTKTKHIKQSTSTKHIANAHHQNTSTQNNKQHQHTFVGFLYQRGYGLDKIHLAVSAKSRSRKGSKRRTFGNIQGTFGERLGHIQGTIGEHTRNTVGDYC
jgi:hypothetical protein